MAEPEFARVRAVFEDALDRPLEERSAFLEEACGADEALLVAVRRLLAAEDPVTGFLDAPSAPSVGRMLGAMEPDTPTLAPGARVGDFRLLRPLARGGMGEVWLAEQESPRRIVALKTMPGGFATENETRRFRFEAEVLARLKHPGIAQILSAGTLGEGPGAVPWFAMEFVEDGRALVEHADERGLDLGRRVRLFLEVCDAVQHGHARGVIHRDLKPANVLVDGAGRPKVIDFGIARMAEPDDGSTQLTRTGEIIGTLRAMAPEQLSGEPDAVDIRADVYALGVLLYELVCGAPPLDLAGKPLALAARAIVEDPPSPPREANPSLPADLSWILLHALEKEPARRYPTVDALAADLFRFLRDEPVEVGPPSALYQLNKWVRRHRPGVAAFAVVVAVALTAGLSVLASDRAARRARAELQDESLKLVDLHLADAGRDLAGRAETLFPATPELAGALDDWVRRAEALLPGIAELEAHSEALAAKAAAAATEDDAIARWLKERLREEADALSTFVAPDGLLERMRKRAALARALPRLTLDGDDARRRWNTARADMGDAERCPAYRGRAIAPQLGLLPLRRDPESELYEFWLVASGAEPRLGADGGWEVDGETGVVLVLLPGGAFEMGASEDDPLARSNERPVNRVELDPFFLARHELTQGQWLRLLGANPSALPGAAHPVETVSWPDVAEVALRLDATLPTEAQWEYAARVGEGPRLVLTGAEVVTGEHESHVPVTATPANAWGLQGMLGNVREWCLDFDGNYEFPVAPGNGLRTPEPEMTHHVARGGNFSLTEEFVALTTRPTWRWAVQADARHVTLGLRLARPLRP